jgi:hypothetical protein
MLRCFMFSSLYYISDSMVSPGIPPILHLFIWKFSINFALKFIKISKCEIFVRFHSVNVATNRAWWTLRSKQTLKPRLAPQTKYRCHEPVPRIEANPIKNANTTVLCSWHVDLDITRHEARRTPGPAPTAAQQRAARGFAFTERNKAHFTPTPLSLAVNCISHSIRHLG